MTASLGVFSKLGAGTAFPVTERYAFLSETLALTEEFVDASGLVGSRSHPKERTRQGIRRVAGSIVMNPTPVELDAWLPRILGAAEVANVFDLAETLPSVQIEVDRVQNRFRYSDCKVTRASFRGSQGSPLEMTLDLIGKDETVTATAFPALSIDLVTNVYMFHDLVLMLDGSPYQCADVEIVVDNAIDADRFFTTQVLTEVNATDRIVTVTTTLPYGDASAAYGFGVSGVPVTATFTNGGVSLLFTMPAVQTPRLSPTVNGRGEIVFTWSGVARKSGSTAELTVTSDSVP